MEASGVVIQHPNRDKPASKATKAAVILLLLTSAVRTRLARISSTTIPFVAFDEAFSRLG